MRTMLYCSMALSVFFVTAAVEDIDFDVYKEDAAVT